MERDICSCDRDCPPTLRDGNVTGLLSSLVLDLTWLVGSVGMSCDQGSVTWPIDCWLL